ncbi:hypothetical protein ERJ75_001545300 [Trypanosoma vivax]|nr:hypothetical protein TRVL_07603 [Trypanosoma vivax]KAH8606132.1 hypothetical protein ERJ75_001545900 [Trypanosoma vivax]KAH8606140.1 hypothetical protein ERJ75_001545300 [Trypanosoma vivax]
MDDYDVLIYKLEPITQVITPHGTWTTATEEPIKRFRTNIRPLSGTVNTAYVMAIGGDHTASLTSGTALEEGYIGYTEDIAKGKEETFWMGKMRYAAKQVD